VSGAPRRASPRHRLLAGTCVLAFALGCDAAPNSRYRVVHDEGSRHGFR
jgi:hypothetical protein